MGRQLFRGVFGGLLRLLVRAAGYRAVTRPKNTTHALCLLCGAAGLFSVALIHDKWLLWLSMVGVGIAWASILAMPYSILAGCLPPNKFGIYMGVFNFSIVLPEITASLCFGWIMNHLLEQ